MQHASHVIHVVDDDSSFRSAIARLLNAAGYEVALYETSQQLLDRPPTRMSDCILLDVQMPGLSGLQLQDRLSKLGNRLPIVFLSGHADIPTSVRAIKAGAEDFLTKPVTKEHLLESIRRALDHAEEVRARSEQADALFARVASLTPRERQVFALVVRGMLNKQIAHELGTSERTVKAHRHMVMQKCGVRSVAELVMIAERTGILPTDVVLPRTMRPPMHRRAAAGVKGCRPLQGLSSEAVN
jgi:RNA polymerase sigma factor (sigma-70 family)